MNQSYADSRTLALTREGEFFRQVFNWMVAGLALTGGAAYFAASSQSFFQLIFGTPLFYIMIFGELALVFILAGRAHRMKAPTATLLFIIYSVLNGLTLSIIFKAYSGGSLATAFFVTAGTFGAMSFYGYTTKRNLASWHGFLFMGLVGIIIATLVNFFLASETIYWLVTYAGVLIFVGLTAYDTQRLRAIAAGGFDSEETQHKAAIIGALALYLDFINLFLMLLRIFGGGRD